MGNKFEVVTSAFLFIVVIAFIIAWPVQWLWNICLVPAIDGLNMIGFWQALGINILFSILFKNSSSSKN